MKTSIANFSNSVIHCSRSKEYRTPFGAQKTGSYVDLAIDVYCHVDEVVLCYAYGLYSLSYNELRCTKKEADGKRWYARLRMPSEPGLLFYWFCLRSKNEDIEKIVDKEYHDFLYRKNEENRTYLYYVASWEKKDGEGKFAFSAPRVGVHEDKYPHAFQITVYDKDFKTPDWMKGAVMYQIFPDRFSRDAEFSFSKMKETENERPERICHEDWYEDVDIYGKESTGYLACDFYGGSLKGIAEKVEYLKSLNVDVLYLNPICEARSNHRYDTADYMNVDPLLGGKEGYKSFSGTMKENGIRYILDGVFSHTGADSKYFNKFNRYPGNGAYSAFKEGKESPYASWYSFWRHEDGQVDYDSWWGFPDLPNVREDDLSYRDYILGPEGVVTRWLHGGASGIRLDVSDELPDSFLREMRSCVKSATGGEGLVLGEVWEDSTTKISYGNYRDFAFGRTHDTVMGYPFRDVLLPFLKGDIDANEWSLSMERMRENFPDEMFYCMMNLISSHDVPRAITVLAGKPDPGDRQAQKNTPLTEDELEKGMALLRLAFFVQMTYPGCPCIYYGDEIGMEGYRDPFNRRTYPWGKETPLQIAQLEEYRKLSALRKENEVFRNGEVRILYAKGDCLIYSRNLDNEGKDHFGKICQGSSNALCILNRSDRINLLVDYDPVSGSIAVQEEEISFDPKDDEMKDNTEATDVSPASKKIVVAPISYKIILGTK